MKIGKAALMGLGTLMLLHGWAQGADLCPMLDNNPSDDLAQAKPMLGGTLQVFRGCSPYWGYNNDSGRGVFINTIDYTQAIEVGEPWPAGTALVWNWPNGLQAGNAPYGFPTIVYGSLLGMNVGIMGPIPMQINSFTTLKAEVAAPPVGAQYDSANILYQIYVTTKANGLAADVVSDVQIWLHKSAFVSLGNPTYTAVYSGISWDVWKTAAVPPQVILIPRVRTDHLMATIDILAILNDLVTKTYFPNTSWINGIQFGAQILKGRGSLRIDRLNYTWE